MGKNKFLLDIKVFILIIISIIENVLRMTPSRGIGSVRHVKCQGKDEETRAHVIMRTYYYI
jgi:hypothetical protein